jgi:hypothetical protein
VRVHMHGRWGICAAQARGIRAEFPTSPLLSRFGRPFAIVGRRLWKSPAGYYDISIISFSISVTDNCEQPLMTEGVQYWSHASASASAPRAKDQGRLVGTFWRGYSITDQMSPSKDAQGTPMKTKHGHAMWSCDMDKFSRVVPSRRDYGPVLRGGLRARPRYSGVGDGTRRTTRRRRRRKVYSKLTQ